MTYDDNHIWMATDGGHKYKRLASIPTSFLQRKAHAYPGLSEYIETRRKEGADWYYEYAKGFRPPCQKKTFETEKDANKSLLRIAVLEQKREKPVRAYECPSCGLWHLTSMPEPPK